MLDLDLQTHLQAQVASLQNRVQLAADLTELVKRDQLPQSSPAAFIVPLGLRGRSAGDASANAFTQMIDEVVGVVLIVRASGDATGAKALPSISTLIWDVILSVCGWAPDDAIGVFYLQRGALVSMSAGSVIYQLDFALQKQIRVIE